MKARLTAIYVVAIFAITGLVPLQFSTPKVDAQSAKAKQTCENRLKKIRKRGLTMNKKTAPLKERYKKVNNGWKKRVSNNHVIANRYANEPQLAGQFQAHKASIKEFQDSVKTYNAKKREYIQERNTQLTSYKKFRANCNTREGVTATTNKMRAWRTDSKTLATKAKTVQQTYVSTVRPSIKKIGQTRNELINARKAIRNAEVASVAAAQAQVTPEETELFEFVDDELIEEGLDEGDPALIAELGAS